jgi:hypothetical protein
MRARTVASATLIVSALVALGLVAIGFALLVGATCTSLAPRESRVVSAPPEPAPK